MIYYRWLDSPIGALLLTSDGRLAQSATAQLPLTGLYLQGQKAFPQQTADWRESESLDVFGQTQAQLAEYFAHQRQQFDLPLAPQGTAFQKQVWQQLLDIPFGETISYGTLAHRVGNPTASRAVGAANGKNPISIVIPCHRVIASNGMLTGYAGGLDRKQWLLQHEQTAMEGDRFLPLQQSLALFDR